MSTDTVPLFWLHLLDPQRRCAIDLVLDLTGFWDRLFAFTGCSYSLSVIPDEGHDCMTTGGTGTYLILIQRRSEYLLNLWGPYHGMLAVAPGEY